MSPREAEYGVGRGFDENTRNQYWMEFHGYAVERKNR